MVTLYVSLVGTRNRLERYLKIRELAFSRQ